eukprot:m.68672 g.68672  ORF g.68672 m.68672 type:complete len:149 (+) comp13919_c0_seq1:106-552(+)
MMSQQEVSWAEVGDGVEAAEAMVNDWLCDLDTSDKDSSIKTRSRSDVGEKQVQHSKRQRHDYVHDDTQPASHQQDQSTHQRQHQQQALIDQLILVTATVPAREKTVRKQNVAPPPPLDLARLLTPRLAVPDNGPRLVSRADDAVDDNR